jgi:hypothetical protein
MRAQSLNNCQGVGVEVTSIFIGSMGGAVQSTLGRVRIQLSWENRGHLYGGEEEFLTHLVFHEQQAESKEKEH